MLLRAFASVCVGSLASGVAGTRPATPTVMSTIPMFTSTVTAGGASYTYTMVGKNPAVPGTGTTTVGAPIVPVKVVFPGGLVRDPTVADAACFGGRKPVDSILGSPVFANHAYTWGATNVGTTQYGDAFRRAEFWNLTGPAGVSPNYHVRVKGRIAPTLVITPPAAKTSKRTGGCKTVGLVDAAWLDGYLKRTVFHNRRAALRPTEFPIFVLYNVVAYSRAPTPPLAVLAPRVASHTGVATCCIHGWPARFANPDYAGALQTFAVASFETSGLFGERRDVSVLSHEVADWLDDPLGDNPTPPWHGVELQDGCQTRLQVGDPFSGTAEEVSINGVEYHVQELAFFSWFYRQSPSLGINGWYSNFATFETSSAPCP